MKKYIPFILLIVMLGCSSPNEPLTSRISIRLDSLINAEHEAGKFDGTIVVGSRDSIYFEKAIGIADRVWDIPMQLDHRFDICSVNKSFVGALFMMAVEEEKLSPDDLLVNRLKDYDYSGKFNEQITLHRLLTHTSGLPDYDAVSQDLSANHFRNLKRYHVRDEEYVDFISQLTPRGNPGEQFYYSNFAYHLMSLILEDIYDMPFSELLEMKITRPLGMEHTFSTISNREVNEKMVEGYNYNDDNDAWERNQFIDLTLGRRIFSTARDLYKWGKAMDTPGWISEESLKEIQTNHVVDINPDISYGYGWVVFDGVQRYRMGDLGIDSKYIIHGGATEGYKSMVVNIENGKYIIAFLANTGDRTDELELTKNIVNLLINSENE